MVTAVSDKGGIELIDAHPDNSIQFKILDASKLDRDRPDVAFGFFRFRPIRAVGGQWMRSVTGQTALYGAQVQTKSDIELYNEGRWSMDQWFGPDANVAPQSTVSPTAWKTAFTGEINFFDYVRIQLSSVIQSADAMAGDYMQSLCDDMRQRVPDVDKPLSKRIQLQPHPATLPADIYSAKGDWETYSTPSRDGRVRQEIMNLPALMARQFRFGIRNKYKVSFNGSPAQFQQLVLQRLANMDRTCVASYTKSDGTKVSMNFSDMVRRAPLMSFDINDCAEKRWGAQGAELRSCRDGDPSNAWYNAEQVMRNTAGKLDANGTQIIRSQSEITLAMLQSGRYVDGAGGSTNFGISRSQQPDLRSYIGSAQFSQELTK